MNIDQEKQESLFDLIALLNQQTIFSEILRLVSTKTSSLSNANVASIVLVNPQTMETLKTVMKVENNVTEDKYKFAQTNIVGWSMKNKQFFLSNDVSNDPRFMGNVFDDIEVKSAMCVPLNYGGEDFGYLVVLSSHEDQDYDSESLKLLERISNIAAPHVYKLQKIKEYFNAQLSEESIQYKYLQLGLIGKSRAFIKLLQSIESASKCDVRVVLEGETGTGKELVAKALHKMSNRSQHPFIAIDCGAIQESLMESELFGHIRGAFTSANRDRKGLIAEANKGTLFMDEINNLSWEMQSKLLRVLQEGEVRPVGSNKKIKVDVRIISASSSSLSVAVNQRLFREDLYFRLMVYPIYIPPLNERKGDIPLLVNHFLKKYSEVQNKKIGFFHNDIINYLKHKHWSGNIRELENFVERAVTHVPQSVEQLEVSMLPENLNDEIKEFVSSKQTVNFISLKESLREHEKGMLLKALEDSDWNQSLAASKMDLLEATLRAKMKKLNIRNKN